MLTSTGTSKFRAYIEQVCEVFRFLGNSQFVYLGYLRHLSLHCSVFLSSFLNLDSDLAIVKRNNALNYYNYISNASVLPILKNYAGTSRFK